MATVKQQAEDHVITVALESGGAGGHRLHAVCGLRDLAGDPNSKVAVREAGGVEALLGLLDDTSDPAVTIAAVQALSCLAVDDPASRDLMIREGAATKLVALLSAGAAPATHAALLALRVLSDREKDRVAIQQAGAITALISLLGYGSDYELAEFSAAVLGNLAAGGQPLKSAIREAGGIPPLVALLQDGSADVAAELAAVVLRNLALGSPVNRQAIVAADGLEPLLRLLSSGQEQLGRAMPCEILYGDIGEEAGSQLQQHRVLQEGLCCFDARLGHLCVAPAPGPRPLHCIFPPRQLPPADARAQRYSLLGKLMLTEPNQDTLDVSFVVGGSGEGAAQLADARGAEKSLRRLHRLLITPCAASELKSAIMRMLTRLHLELEFKNFWDGREPPPAKPVTLQHCNG